MKVIWQHHDGVQREGMTLSYLPECGTQLADIIGEEL